MVNVARHVADLPKSGIRKFFDIVADMKDVVSLGIGEPDFDTPWHISEAAAKSLGHGGTHYTSNLGTPALRQAIARYLKRRFGAEFDWTREILATVGVSEGIDLAIRALIAPGDEVIYQDPGYVSYAATIQLAHGVPVRAETRFEDGFRLTVAELERRVTSKTKALLLNFPCNPTGTMLSGADMLAILEFARRHDLIVISDEVYTELSYFDPMPETLASFASFPEYRDRVVLLNGFSKAWAMTGYRLGYACGPHSLIDAMMKIHQYGIMSAPTLAQVAGVEALEHGDNDVETMRREYRRRRDYLVPRLNDLGLKVHCPQGAFYLFPDVSSTGRNGEEFATELLSRHQVACVPGEAFGVSGRNFVRISYATAMDKLELAVERIGRYCKECSLPQS